MPGIRKMNRQDWERAHDSRIARIDSRIARIDRIPPRGELSFISRNARCAGQSNLLSLTLLLFFTIHPLMAAEPSQWIGQQFSAEDTLQTGEESDPDARECLQGLSWKPVSFQVAVEAPLAADRGEATIRFPSPLSPRDDESANVVMEWYAARHAEALLATAPAVVVVHESGRNMTVGRMIAQGFSQRGIHAFLVQLPGYGARRWQQKQVDAVRLKSIPQGVGDVRRARDAVAALPGVERNRISLQGTSLGGFIASTAAGLDHGYANVFLLLSGGDVFTVLQNGDRDAAKWRQNAKDAGLDEEALRELVWQIEPNRLAHRVNPERTWLYSGVFDTIVPIANARSFATAAKLSESHHVLMPVDHFAGILLLPAVLDQMAAVMQQAPPAN